MSKHHTFYLCFISLSDGEGYTAILEEAPTQIATKRWLKVLVLGKLADGPKGERTETRQVRVINTSHIIEVILLKRTILLSTPTIRWEPYNKQKIHYVVPSEEKELTVK